MPHPTAGRRAAISRRTTLLALPTAASVVALAGCRWGPEDETTEVPSGATPPPADSDQELVDQAVAAIATTAAVVAATFEARPRLRDRLAGFTTLHEAHLLQFEATPSDEIPNARSWPGVLAAERTLQDQLVEFAAAADSGQLARVLASMAAGIAQLVALTSDGAAA